MTQSADLRAATPDGLAIKLRVLWAATLPLQRQFPLSQAVERAVEGLHAAVQAVITRGARGRA